ncbi:hypothetical protein AVEN_92572-1 [Araneus ventricosus]|uniref:Uncharacterized protein n=1 Tax=Araneus ventricosus TaxID=182803 RepID=A0A4Y2AHT3_ARAVE|nr:hypothetical protein AVEN_92572-1 [Araneus ventricosus]
MRWTHLSRLYRSKLPHQAGERLIPTNLSYTRPEYMADLCCDRLLDHEPMTSWPETGFDTKPSRQCVISSKQVNYFRHLRIY